MSLADSAAAALAAMAPPPATGVGGSLSAALYQPHTKEYCVMFQSKYASLKGIENSWTECTAEVEASWENQQHGRNHHLKVVIKNPVEGHAYALKLMHEDGGDAPAFTRTKTGKRKPTMLVGIDCREPRLGLSWTYLSNEGPRHWMPSCNCVIKVGAPNWSSLCEGGIAGGGDASEVAQLLVPAGRDIVVPIRIDVLSAAKGAVNFSRYMVSVFETSGPLGAGKDGHAELPGGWSWESPPVLIEAKWLPAALVRMVNKQKFWGGENSGKSSSSSSSAGDQGQGAGGHGQSAGTGAGAGSGAGAGAGAGSVYGGLSAAAAAAAAGRMHSSAGPLAGGGGGGQVCTSLLRDAGAGVGGCGDGHSHSHAHIGGGASSSSAQAVGHCEDSFDQAVLGAKVLTHFLMDGTFGLHDRSRLAHLDFALHELQCALSHYNLARCVGQTPAAAAAQQHNQRFHGGGRRASQVQQQQETSTLAYLHQAVEQEEAKRLKRSADAADGKKGGGARKKKKENLSSNADGVDEAEIAADGDDGTKADKHLLSSPPRGARFAGPGNLAALELPGSSSSSASGSGSSSGASARATGGRRHQRATRSGDMAKFEQAHAIAAAAAEANFTPFDLLATAASSAKLAPPRK